MIYPFETIRMKRLIQFDSIHSDFCLNESFKGHVVYLELIKKSTLNLEAKYLSICFQIANELTNTQGKNYTVNDVIFINYNSIYNKKRVSDKVVRETGNTAFIFEKKHYSEMNEKELSEFIDETIEYWRPHIKNLK